MKKNYPALDFDPFFKVSRSRVMKIEAVEERNAEA
jgi:hypothetical protein